LLLLRTPIRTIVIPIAHDLVHAAAVHTAGQAAFILYPVAKELRSWRKFLTVDVAVQGQVHSEDKRGHVLLHPGSTSARCPARSLKRPHYGYRRSRAIMVSICNWLQS